ncbi:MAG: hypothetical protein IPJ88_18005 [Myxococcales bacterium]|nr:MAG: hypothetical protein IPJ88_18005 [Myxococcales bacterium]
MIHKVFGSLLFGAMLSLFQGCAASTQDIVVEEIHRDPLSIEDLTFMDAAHASPLSKYEYSDLYFQDANEQIWIWSHNHEGSRDRKWLRFIWPEQAIGMQFVGAAHAIHSQFRAEANFSDMYFEEDGVIYVWAASVGSPYPQTRRWLQLTWPELAQGMKFVAAAHAAPESFAEYSDLYFEDDEGEIWAWAYQVPELPRFDGTQLRQWLHVIRPEAAQDMQFVGAAHSLHSGLLGRPEYTDLYFKAESGELWVWVFESRDGDKQVRIWQRVDLPH